MLIFGLAYILGASKISFPARKGMVALLGLLMRVAERETVAVIEWSYAALAAVLVIFLSMIECVACSSFWFGMIASATVEALHVVPIGGVLGWVAHGCLACGASVVLAYFMPAWLVSETVSPEEKK